MSIRQTLTQLQTACKCCVITSVDIRWATLHTVSAAKHHASITLEVLSQTPHYLTVVLVSWHGLATFAGASARLPAAPASQSSYCSATFVDTDAARKGTSYAVYLRQCA